MWAESWKLMKWVCWVWGEGGQLRLGVEGCWAGWGCLRGLRVLSEVAAAAAAVGWLAEVVAAAQVDADVAALHC